jgi:hypothetical protein
MNHTAFLFAAVILLTSCPVLSQTWQAVHQPFSNQAAWSEVSCNEGGGWQQCDFSGASFPLASIVFSREVLQNFPGQTLSLNRVQGAGTQKLTGLNYGPTGGYKASQYGTYLVISNGEHSASIQSTKPKPDHWPKSQCEIDPSNVLCGYQDMESGYMNPVLTLYMPSSVNVALQKRFTDIGTMFAYDYTTHESNFGSTRYTCSNTGTQALHSAAHLLSFGYEGSCRMWGGSMSANEFANSSSTDFMVPEPINLVVVGEVISVNKIPAEEIAEWAGVPVVSNYRIELNYDEVSITDNDAYFNQKMANGWSSTRFNNVGLKAWKATPIAE